MHKLQKKQDTLRIKCYWLTADGFCWPTLIWMCEPLALVHCKWNKVFTTCEQLLFFNSKQKNLTWSLCLWRFLSLSVTGRNHKCERWNISSIQWTKGWHGKAMKYFYNRWQKVPDFLLSCIPVNNPKELSLGFLFS